jgi:hypothetical protein
MGNPSQVEVKILTDADVVLWWGYADSLGHGVETAVLRGISMAGADLRGRDLHGRTLAGGNFTGAHFEGANLIGVDFTNANLTSADFSGAAVTEVTWSGATMTSADQDALATAAVASTAGTCIPTTEKAAASGVASLSATSKVVQDPANATATPTAAKIPIATAAKRLDGWTAHGVAPTAVSVFPYVVLDTDGTLNVTLGAGAVVAALPTAVGCAGRELTVKIVATGGGSLAVTPDGTEQVEDAGAGVALAMATLNQTFTLKSNNVGWDIINAHPVPAAHAATTHRNGQSDEIKLPPVDTAAATPFAALVTHNVILGAATAGFDQVVNLYAADAAAVGRTVSITKEDVNAHNVVPTPDGADTIDGVNAAGASSTVTVQFGFVDLQCVAVGAWRSMAARLA